MNSSRHHKQLLLSGSPVPSASKLLSFPQCVCVCVSIYEKEGKTEINWERILKRMKQERYTPFMVLVYPHGVSLLASFSALRRYLISWSDDDTFGINYANNIFRFFSLRSLEERDREGERQIGLVPYIGPLFFLFFISFRCNLRNARHFHSQRAQVQKAIDVVFPPPYISVCFL